MTVSDLSLVDRTDESTFDIVFCIDGPLAHRRKMVSKGATEANWPDLPRGKYVKSTELVADEYAWLYVAEGQNEKAVLARYKTQKPSWAGIVNARPEQAQWGWRGQS